MHLSRLVLLGTLIAVASAMPAKAGAVKKSTSKKSVQQKTKSVQIYTTHSGITTTRALSTLAVSIGTPPASHKPTSTSTEKAQHTTTRVSSTSSTSKGTPPASRKSTSTSTKKAQQTTIRVSSTSSTSKGTPPASHKSTSTSTKKAQQTSTRVSSTSSTSKGTPPATNTPTSNSLNYQNIDSSATSGARALLKYLQSQFGSHILSGQQDAGSLKWVQQNVGKTPAIQGNDFMDYSPSRVAYGAKSTAVEDAIAFDKEGGINAFVWHWNAPTSLYNTAAEPWYSGFYTAATSFNIQAALAQGSGGSDYKLILRDIDAIAVEIKRLSDAGIPILFRPLHEPDGGWFWWGAHGSAPFLQLWGILYDRITNYHGLHNIVWVCNTFVPSWYPGNSKCDIATTDVYPAAGDHNPQVSAWNSLHQVTSGQRILALAEVGVVPDPSSCMSQHVPWAYWVVWSGSFISGGSDNSMQFLKTLYSSSSIVTVDSTTRLGSWKSA